MREFNTGSTRSSNDNKLDFSGFLSPLASERFCEYMFKHRVCEDGTLRDSDNWKKGIPIKSYKESMIRHMFQAWSAYEGYNPVDDKGEPIDFTEALCAIMFNVQGLLHELSKEQLNKK